MAVTDVIIKNQFYLEPQTTDSGIEWMLISNPETLSRTFLERKTRFLEQYRKKEEKINIHLPVDGIYVVEWVIQKLKEEPITGDYTELSFIPPKRRNKVDEAIDFLRGQTKDITSASIKALEENIAEKYGTADKVEIGRPEYPSSLRDIDLSWDFSNYAFTIALNFGNILFKKEGIPFYFNDAEVRYLLDTGEETIKITPVLPHIAANMYLMLKDRQSTPKKVFDAFESSEIAGLQEACISIQPFVNLLGNRRRVNEKPHQSNDSGGLYMYATAKDEKTLNALAGYLNQALKPQIKSHGLNLDFSDKWPEYISEADMVVIRQIEKKR